MGFWLLIAASILIYTAVGMCIGYGQSRTNSFFILGGVPFALGAYFTAILLTNEISAFEALIIFPFLFCALFGILGSIWSALHNETVNDLVGLSLVIVGAAITRSWYHPEYASGSWQSLTNGSFGLNDFPDIIVFGSFNVSGRFQGLLFSIVVVAICYFIVKKITKSLWGISVEAIKDNRLQAALDGHRISQRQMGIGALLGGCLGISGAAYTLTYQYIDPSIWSLPTIIGICLIPLIFPYGPFWVRSLVGSLVFVLLPELLSQLSVVSPYETYIRNLLFFAFAIFVGLTKRPKLRITYEHIENVAVNDE